MTDPNRHSASGAVYCAPRPVAGGGWAAACACPRLWHADSRPGVYRKLRGHRCDAPGVDEDRARVVLGYLASNT